MGNNKIIQYAEPMIASLRGRNPSNPSDRKTHSDGTFVQRLEVGSSETSNTLTTVTKDNLVLSQTHEPQTSDLTAHTVCSHYSKMSERDCLKDDGRGQSHPVVVETTAARYRIRKLTERECFRLMGVDDADTDKIQRSGVSRTQQYKMAGNSIVVDVLYHIFRQALTNDRDDSAVQLSLF